MNYKSFSDSFWQHLEATLQNLKQQNIPLYAAFDADGTLWDTDLGENFFQYQIDRKLVVLPPHPFDHYLTLKKENPTGAFAWLAQINKDQPLEIVNKWADEAFKTIQPNPIFKDQKKLIDYLLKEKVQIFIVTASITWAVQAGAKFLGLDPSCVIGVQTEIHNGLITDKTEFPITYKKGKVDALLLKTNNNYPFLASGNSMGDYELLKSATQISLAVSASSPDDPLFKTEQELQNIAITHNWFHHRFI